jgi:hypothetical protein
MMVRSRTSTPGPRREDFEHAVAEALRRLGDTVFLDDSPLADLPEVIRLAENDRRLFARGEALSCLLSGVLVALTERLTGGGRVALIRKTLEGVGRGHSIASIAREQQKTREWWSRHYWKLAVGLVADELLSLNGESRSSTLSAGHGRHKRVPAFQKLGGVRDE